MKGKSTYKAAAYSKMPKKDDSIYNAIIASLVIGIIAVVITLILAKPAPETFTELYFENHKSLPKYAQLGNSYDYSFTIANHENASKEYNYTITKELYNLNYACESPNLYFGGNIAESKEPSSYIKEDKYEISFNYRVRNGHAIAVKLKDIQAKEIYSFMINETAETMHFRTQETESENKINIEPKKVHSIRIIANSSNLKFFIDRKQVFNETVKGYKNGFLSFETPNTYADIFDLGIKRGDISQKKASIKSDARIENIEMKKYPEAPKSVFGGATGLAIRKMLQKGEGLENSSIAEYTAPLNLSNYNLELLFRIIKGDKISIKMGNFEIFYNETKKELSVEGYKIQVPIKEKNEWHRIRLEMGSNARIYFDYKFIKEMPYDNAQENISLTAFDSDVKVQQFVISANAEPYVINYKIPGLRPNAIPASLLEEPSEQNSIYWEDYIITADYTKLEKNGTLSLSVNSFDGELYSLSINNNNAEIRYKKYNQTQRIAKEIPETPSPKIVIKAIKNELSIDIGNKNMLNKRIDNANGFLLVNNTGIRLEKLNVENMQSKETRIYGDEEINCNMILLKKYSRNETSFVGLGEKLAINSSASFHEKFDIAKVQVSLGNRQEIHFWVMQI